MPVAQAVTVTVPAPSTRAEALHLERVRPGPGVQGPAALQPGGGARGAGGGPGNDNHDGRMGAGGPGAGRRGGPAGTEPVSFQVGSQAEADIGSRGCAGIVRACWGEGNSEGGERAPVRRAAQTDHGPRGAAAGAENAWEWASRGACAAFVEHYKRHLFLVPRCGARIANLDTAVEVLEKRIARLLPRGGAAADQAGQGSEASVRVSDVRLRQPRQWGLR
eukprot:336720-Rhodomonas_salina.2